MANHWQKLRYKCGAKYDYKQSQYVKEKGKTYTTDANGFFKMDKVRRDGNGYSNYSYLLDITHNNDKLFMNDLVFNYYYTNESVNEESKVTTSIHLFTDRSLYRPGQTVYFKGIVLSRNAKEKKAVLELIMQLPLFSGMPITKTLTLLK